MVKYAGPFKSEQPAPCVWVSAGVLAGGLCDRDFDCDGCPLHLALTRFQNRQLPGNLNWPRGRRYTPNQLWLQREDEHVIRLGLTPFGAELLHPVMSWHMPAVGKRVHAHGSLATATTPAGPVPLILPFAARVKGTNPRIEADALWPLADPWESGYLLELEVRDWHAVERATTELNEAAAQLAERKADLNRVASQSGFYDREEMATADGGSPVSGWSQVLSHRDYRMVLADVFGVAPLRCTP